MKSLFSEKCVNLTFSEFVDSNKKIAKCPDNKEWICQNNEWKCRDDKYECYKHHTPPLHCSNNNISCKKFGLTCDNNNTIPTIPEIVKPPLYET